MDNEIKMSWDCFKTNGSQIGPILKKLLQYTGWPAKKYPIFPGHNFFINWVRNLKQISLESVYFKVCLWYTTIFPKYHLPLQYKSRADLQSSWLHAGEHRERWTLWLQPPSALDLWSSMVWYSIFNWWWNFPFNIIITSERSERVRFTCYTMKISTLVC